MAGTLYLVGTPIGNLGDISARALETLAAADFIAAEDTRVSIKLLNHYGIKKPLVSYYEHNREESGAKILSRLIAGETCALVTDAGMPAISDPGEALVALCAEAGIETLVIPGACAAVSALALSALPTGRFTFEGFLSVSRKSRAEHLQSLKSETRTMIFYEAPHKLVRTLTDMLEAFGDRRVSLSRELTKLHEETFRTTLSGALARYGASETAPRGEFVLVLEGAEVRDEEVTLETAIAIARGYIAGGMSARDAVRAAAEETGFPKNELYNALRD
ncbi:MAG: 16S rRNA (cytidine(1402)-2'-O)-methyltransferase [Oscillospiraceae bacterium]|jgi:16S rRNA (cytidine1402-2'-O)-methyltransferase|nr:16S rRNA (cytidine(1402)-2'-O)-methyltransferase [Oscillospiraceae bacterium]